VWVIRLVLLLLVVFVLVYVLAANMDQTVDLEFFNYEYLDTPLVYVVAACFALGFLVALAVMVMREIRHQRQIAALRRQGRKLEKELADLRALPLQELSGESGAKGD
jgi:uncharacterized integral membrane protein